MHLRGLRLLTVGTVSLAVTGCSGTAEIAERRAAIFGDIEDVLSLTVQSEDHVEPQRCLTESQYRNFTPLGDRHLLFEGRGNALWVNTLRGRCADIPDGDVLLTRSFTGRRLCDGDQFTVANWFNLGRSTRAPFSRGGLPPATRCSLGRFQRVSEGQVAEIEALLEDW